MSLAEIERFAVDLKSNSALRAEAEKMQADKSHAAPLARSVAFAASKGYGFTIEEARQHVQARAAAQGKVLTDTELDGIAGGAWNPFANWCYST
jgi:predicted deacylase